MCSYLIIFLTLDHTDVKVKYDCLAMLKISALQNGTYTSYMSNIKETIIWYSTMVDK